MIRNCKGTLSGFHNSTVHGGTPPCDVQEWAKTTVYFHGFADLPAERGKATWSPNFHCLGYEWYVELYPGGVELEDDGSDATTKQVSVYLHSDSETRNIHIDCKLVVRSNTKIKGWSYTHKFVNDFGIGTPQFVDRNIALQHLIHEALVIEVRMKPVKYPPPFIPDNPSDCRTLKKSFMDEDFADIVFHVGGEELDVSGITEQGIKDSATKFYAHRIILKHAAPLLAELGATSETSPASVEIPNVSPAAFKSMLLYIYGCKIPDFGSDISLTKDIIAAADKFGVINLKLEAEAIYVASIKLTFENVLDTLLFADSKNCALLKEEIMDFVEINATELLEKETLKGAPDGLFHDTLAAMARRNAKKDVANKKRKRVANELSISDLRRDADSKGLDVDGSREMLIAAIKAADDDKDKEDEDENEDDVENNPGENGD
jgi:hypothetical protein